MRTPCIRDLSPGFVGVVIKCAFKSFVFIGPFKISTDNYLAVDDSALYVYKQYGFAHW